VRTWATVFLGIIAVATLITAILQVVLLVAAAQLVRRLMKFVADLDRQITPIIGHVDSIARDASRVASLATAQIERADQVLNSAVVRIEELLSHMQTLVVNTLREGNALMMGVRAVMAAIRAFQGRKRRRAEDDETLFI
jgi:signal transduction histidine kinase